MNTAALRAIMARSIAAARAIDWRAVGARTTAGLQLCWAVAQLLFLLGAVAVDYAWQHRQQIRAALVHAVACLVVAAEVTYRAGCWTRHQLERFSGRAAVLVSQQPLPAVAPITATMQAAREALERLIARLYPVLAA